MSDAATTEAQKAALDAYLRDEYHADLEIVIRRLERELDAEMLRIDVKLAGIAALPADVRKRTALLLTACACGILSVTGRGLLLDDGGADSPAVTVFDETVNEFRAFSRGIEVMRASRGA